MEKIQVVLASPSDLADERQMIKDLVNSLNPLYMKNRNYQCRFIYLYVLEKNRYKVSKRRCCRYRA